MSRSRGGAEYAELSGRRVRRPRRSWLRAARLNLVGWSALLGLCLVAAAVGVAVAAALGLPRPFGVVCGVIPLIAVVILDRRRWARMQSSSGWGGSVEEVVHVVALLEARGVHAQVLLDDVPPSWAEPAWPHAEAPRPATASLHYLNRDGDAVRKALRENGIGLPDMD